MTADFPERMQPDAEAALRDAFRDEWGRLVAALIRVTGDWALAEDCVQDAFATAAVRWPVHRVPRRPGAWLTTTARNGALDRLRRASTEARKLQEIAVMDELDELGTTRDSGDGDDGAIPDDRLRLIFTCCHPALPLDARVALTLRTLCGLTVAEIARAFGASEHAMSKRLVRARQKITNAGIPYRVPTGNRLPERLDGVLAVLYLLFTEGYAPTSGAAVVREPLSGEAIRLTRTLSTLLPGDPEVLGLLALELLHDARRAARADTDGNLIPLEEQDRSRWDSAQIAGGVDVLMAADRVGVPRGPYLVQALIAACHSTAPAASDTDWSTIAALYDELAVLAPSPYVELSRAVAVGMSAGPDAGLRLVAALETSGELAGNHYVAATKADLLRRAHLYDEAAAAYVTALDLVNNDAERLFLQRRLSELPRR
ncbi:MAG: polymerase ECF-subfamily sigma factor [Frankiales bacterium]|nr:polymerase ECF-subfamily sigma factor [Frankiales bacterium]